MSLSESMGSKIKRISFQSPCRHMSVQQSNLHKTDSFDFVENCIVNRNNNNKTLMTIPQLLCESETLKEEVLKLRKENQLLMEYKQNFVRTEHKQIAFRESFPQNVYKRQFACQGIYEKQYSEQDDFEEKKQEYEETQVCLQEEVRHKEQMIKIQNEEIQSLRIRICEMEKQLKDQRSEKKELQGQMSFLSHKLGLKQKQICTMEQTIEEYAELMKEQNMKIAQLLRERINLGELSRCASEAISHQNVTASQVFNHQKEEDNQLERELKKYEQKLGDYSRIKDDNYRLRNLVAELSVKNTCLFNNSYKHTHMIEHLWKIKQVEYNQINKKLLTLSGQLSSLLKK